MARVKTAGAGAVSYGKKETLLSYETAQMDVSVDASWNHLFCDFQICTNGGVGYIFPKLQPLFGNLGK